MITMTMYVGEKQPANDRYGHQYIRPLATLELDGNFGKEMFKLSGNAPAERPAMFFIGEEEVYSDERGEPFYALDPQTALKAIKKDIRHELGKRTRAQIAANLLEGYLSYFARPIHVIFYVRS